MYDFIKATIAPEHLGGLVNHPLLEFEGIHNERTGTISPKKTAEYRGLKFIVYDSGYIELQGSLHKYKNKGFHNYDDFTLEEFSNIVQEVEGLFAIDFLNCRLKNLEIGVNICPPNNTTNILNGLLIHKQEKFKDVSMINGNYKQARHQRYFVKVYDKYAQYQSQFKLNEPVLRFELKFIKMADLNKEGICTIADLQKKSNLDTLKKMLLVEWSNVLLFDKTINSGELKQYTKQVKYHQWQNPYYWANLNKQARSKQKKIYNQVVKLHSANIHEQIRSLISKKWDRLTNKKYYHLTSLENPNVLLINHSSIGLKGILLTNACTSPFYK